MTDITIGALDTRLMLQSPVRVSDGAGGASIGWTLIDEVWAHVRAVGGAERLEAEGLKGRVTHEVWVRYRDGVAPDMRFLLGPRALDIRAVLETAGRRRYLRCLCEERVA